MTFKALKLDWLYNLKRKILLSILFVLTVSILVIMVSSPLNFATLWSMTARPKHRN
jgi:hypothetical protein